MSVKRIEEALARSWPIEEDNLTVDDRVVFMEAAAAHVSCLRDQAVSRDQAAHRIMVYSWSSDAMEDMVSPADAFAIIDVALGASRSTPNG